MSNDTKIEDYEREPVPQHLRKSWLSMAFVWIAIGIDLSAMFLGATRRGHEHRRLAYGGHRRFSDIGHNRGCLRICGAKTGLSTAMISRFLFGNKGALIVSVILGISSLGWFGVQVGFFASNFQTALSELWGWHWSLWVLSIIGGLLMMSTAIWGYRAIEN